MELRFINAGLQVLVIMFSQMSFSPGEGGGGTPLYGLYKYVQRQRVWFFSRFGHK